MGWSGEGREVCDCLFTADPNPAARGKQRQTLCLVRVFESFDMKPSYPLRSITTPHPTHHQQTQPAAPHKQRAPAHNHQQHRRLTVIVTNSRPPRAIPGRVTRCVTTPQLYNTSVVYGTYNLYRHNN